jgi:hypothetical protein
VGAADAMSAIPVTLISMIMIKDTEFKIKIFPILTWYCFGSLTFMEAHILLAVWTGGPREREKLKRNVQEMFKKHLRNVIQCGISGPARIFCRRLCQ